MLMVAVRPGGPRTLRAWISGSAHPQSLYESNAAPTREVAPAYGSSAPASTLTPQITAPHPDRKGYIVGEKVVW